MANPFFGADAIFMDGGFSFVGAEKDWGGFFILTGKDKGKFVAYSEIAGGAAPDAGGGIEIGRVDVFGDPALFTSADLFGRRDKVWVTFVIVGGAFALSETQDGRTVLSTAIQLGRSVGPLDAFLFGWSGGLNRGVVEP